MSNPEDPFYSVKSDSVNFHSVKSDSVKYVSVNSVMSCRILSNPEAQLQKVFLPPGTGFLRQNFPNIEEEFS